jgi:hypothetical protein
MVGMLWSGRRQHGGQAPGLATIELEALEGLGAGDFMDQLPVDVDEGGAVGFHLDHVGIPEFVMKSTGLHEVGNERIRKY